MSDTFVYESEKTFLSDLTGEAASLVTYVGLEQYGDGQQDLDADVTVSDGSNVVRFGGYTIAGTRASDENSIEEFLQRITKVRDGLTAVIEATKKAQKDIADQKVQD